jgi:cytoskeletal protein RodZ
MRQRLDIVDVEERTKIRAKYLRALENEEWGLLPGPTFVRTFLRTYAEAVGLDPHVIVEEYRAANDDDEEPEPQPQPLANKRPRRARSERRRPRAPGPPSPLVFVGAAVVAVIAFLVILGLVGGDDGGKDKASSTTPTSTAPQKSSKPRRATARTPAGVTLRIAPTVPTYVCVDSGDGSPHVFEGILSQPRTFKNGGELRANLGKRSVKITANGKPMPVANTADPLGLRVTKAGAREITTGPRPCA